MGMTQRDRFEQILAEIRAVAKNPLTLTHLHQACAKEHKELIITAMVESGRDPKTGKANAWPLLKRRSKVTGSKKSWLLKTGKFWGSLKMSATNQGWAISSGLDYAQKHQTGEGRLPARPWNVMMRSWWGILTQKVLRPALARLIKNQVEGKLTSLKIT